MASDKPQVGRFDNVFAKSQDANADRAPYLLCLSAKSPGALEELIAGYAVYAKGEKTGAIADICFTAAVGRSHFPERAAVVAASVPELAQRLADLKLFRARAEESGASRFAFLFSGQGSQYLGMGAELYKTEPAFKSALDNCAEILTPILGRSIIEVMFEDESSINQTKFTQPALFALEYSLYVLWKSWGIEPQAVMGHSVGEVVAACVAGVFTLEDGLKMIAKRAELMQGLGGKGGMAAVMCSAEKAMPYLAKHGASLAAVNGPEIITISGFEEKLAKVFVELKSAGIAYKELVVSHAFHSEQMDAMLSEFETFVSKLKLTKPRMKLISNLTGQVAGEEVTTAKYWSRHVREAVSFYQGIQTLHAEGFKNFLEIGPGTTLVGMAGRCLTDEASAQCAWIPSLRSGRDDRSQVLDACAQLYVRGAKIDWKAFDRNYAERKRVSLPTYPFQKQRYWIDSNNQSARITGEVHELLGARFESALEQDKVFFERPLSNASSPVLREHKVFGQSVLPGAGFVETFLAAAVNMKCLAPVVLEDFSIERPLVIADGEMKSLQTAIARGSNGDLTLTSLSKSQSSSSWIRHATGRIAASGELESATTIDLDQLRAVCDQDFSIETVYSDFLARGLAYGPRYRCLRRIQGNGSEALAELSVSPEFRDAAASFEIFPGLLDACFQMIAAFGGDLKAEPLVPVAIKKLVLYRTGASEIVCHFKLVRREARLAQIDLVIADRSGQVIARVDGLTLVAASKEAMREDSGSEKSALQDWVYQAQWKQIFANAESPQVVQGHWLIFADRTGVGAALAKRIRADGAKATLVYASSLPAGADPDAIAINAENRADFTTAIARAMGEEIVSRVVSLWALDATDDFAREDHKSIYLGGLHTTQAMVENRGARDARLTFVTRGAQDINQDGTSAIGARGLQQSPLLGLARVIDWEHPELECQRYDLEAYPSENEVQRLIASIAAPSRLDCEVADRGGNIWARRIGRESGKNLLKTHGHVGAGQPAQIGFTTRGVLDNLRLLPLSRRQPAAGEIEIRVRAAGLNFRDVMNVMGVYPGDPGALGCESAGEVVAVGEGVKRFRVGDEVMAIPFGSFSTHLTVSENLVASKPNSISFAQAATIPVSFLTAYHSLVTLGKIGKGKRVLIHAAAGGLGMAAIQIARNAGAELFVTVGNEEKRRLMTAMGVKNIFNSRTLEFSEQILKMTDGEGVDYVLNALAGEFIPKSIATLRKGGCFLEVGKTGVWTTEQVAQARPDVHYHVIALDSIIQRDPEFIRGLFDEVAREFAAGKLQPLPTIEYDFTEAEAAFRFMAQGKHTGKIVLNWSRAGEIRAEATYLISGGLGGLGLAVASDLIDRGARNIALVSRRGPNAEGEAAVAALVARGARVEVMSADIGIKSQVEDVLHTISNKQMPPVRGVIHAAGVTDDAALIRQAREQYESVASAKIAGSWYLHEALAGHSLDFFVTFSSATSLLGNSGQASYAAGNAFLDSLASFRRGQNLPALNINWGPWAGSGLAAKMDARSQKVLQENGLMPLSQRDGIGALTSLMDRANWSGGVVNIAWDAFVSRINSVAEKNLFSDVTPALSSRSVASSTKTESALLQGVPEAEREEKLIALLQNEIRAVLGLGGTFAIDPRKGLMSMGMDSLMSVEFRNRLRKLVGEPAGRKIPSTLIFDYPTLEALTKFMLNEVVASAAVKSTVAAKKKTTSDESIAIVGMACRYPGGANDPALFWDNVLENGLDATSEIPRDRWKIEEYFDQDADASGKTYATRGGFIGDPGLFDAAFFGISPHEAKVMDPQQRLLLEVSWEALEDANCTQEKIFGSRTGVFVGASSHDYADLIASSSKETVYTGTGTNESALAGRVSYLLGLQGPSFTVNTACSSGLVAIHLACQSLRNQESDLALASGVNLNLSPRLFIAFSRARMLSPTGRCASFDASADGYARSEGCGVVVLKRLSDAVAAGDNVLAVVRGSAINQDGRSSTLTAPNGIAQENLIREALANSQTTPSEIGYFEAHGTGTPLGDPIEVQALSRVMRDGRKESEPLILSSVKANIGHAESAAGHASVIKTVLALQKKRIPPHVHFKKLNPNISFEGLSVVIPQTVTEWKPINGKRLAGVSSFGFTGTNAHVVLAEAPLITDARNIVGGAERPLHLLTLSARNEAALIEMAARYATRLTNSDANLGDICFTAAVGRSLFEERVALVAGSTSEMKEKLAAIASKSKVAGSARGRVDEVSKLAFLFSGQGSQYLGMGAELYKTQPTFKKALDECAKILNPILGRSIIEVMFEDEASLNQTKFTQPALFALEYSLNALWKSWGIEPQAVMGHSVGEVVAACVAGVFSLEDGLKLIAKRAELMQGLGRKGGMAAVMCSAEKAMPYLAKHGVSLAAVNGPEIVTISGFEEKLANAYGDLKKDGVAFKELVVSHAFHSEQMDAMLSEFETFVSKLKLTRPRLKLISNLTGQVAGEEVTTAKYWSRHVREAVSFYQGIATLHAEGFKNFLEIGPGTTLVGMAGRCLEDEASAQCAWISSLKKGRGDWQPLLEAAAQLFVRGTKMDWAGFEKDSPARKKVQLPIYPFQRQRYWFDLQTSSGRVMGAEANSFLTTKFESSAHEGETTFESIISTNSPAFLGDHRVYDVVVVPGATYFDMAISAAAQVFGDGQHIIEDLQIEQPLIVPDGQERRTQIVLSSEGEKSARFQIVSRARDDHGAWMTHVVGKVSTKDAVSNQAISIEQLRAAHPKEASAKAHYESFARLGLPYGETFRGVEQVHQGDRSALGRVVLAKKLEVENALHQIHPTHLDACFQVLVNIVEADGVAPKDRDCFFLPFSCERYVQHRKVNGAVWVRIASRPTTGQQGKLVATDFTIYGDDGTLLAEGTNFVCVEAPKDALLKSLRAVAGVKAVTARAGTTT